MPSTAARDSSNDVIVPERAVSSSVAPTFEPMRIEMLVDLENSDTIVATDAGSSVGPVGGASCGMVMTVDEVAVATFFCCLEDSMVVVAVVGYWWRWDS